MTKDGKEPDLPSGLRPEGQGLGPTRAGPMVHRQPGLTGSHHEAERHPEGLRRASSAVLPPLPSGQVVDPPESLLPHRLGGRSQAHLPHKVLDAAQLALDAGSVQQRLPHIVAPVPLWAQAPQNRCVLGAEAEGTRPRW